MTPADRQNDPSHVWSLAVWPILFIAILLIVSAGGVTFALLKAREAEAAQEALDATLEEEKARLEAEAKVARDSLISAIEIERARLMGEVDAAHVEAAAARAELARVEKFRHIPGVIEKARKAKEEADAKVAAAQLRAREIVAEAEGRSDEVLRLATDAALETTRKANREAEAARQRASAGMVAERKAVDEEIAKLRREARERTKKSEEKGRQAEEALDEATRYARDIRRVAEVRAEEIGGQGYEARRRAEHYEAVASAMQHAVEGYGDSYLVPSAHVLDELADDFGFDVAGRKLKIARARTAAMQKNGTAAACNYPEGWKRDYAINFVLGAFNGKVDSILARLKPANQRKLAQEIRDAFALVNHNGEVFKEARIHEEYLDARLEELKWGTAVQRLKDNAREEQRAIREQMKEEAKAKREIERAIRQSEKEEALIAKAIEKARLEFQEASGEEKAKYEARLQELGAQLAEAEEKNRKAVSMAQQTKTGHVYVISNIGSFGEDVYKIGLTRRINKEERVRELGDASVPFSFDTHVMIRSEDAPALEAALHRRFVANQVNKINRRKEFFRVSLRDIRKAVEEMKCEATWTMAAEARDYRETQELERKMREDPSYKARWTKEQAAREYLPLFDEEEEQAEGATAEDWSAAEQPA